MAKSQKGNRDERTGQFKPGMSGNPGGKPKMPVEVAAAFREITIEARDTLREVMLDKEASSAARVSAATVIIERGWGKAPQTVTLLRDNADLKDLTDDELVAIAAGTRTNGGDDPSATPEGQGLPN